MADQTVTLRRKIVTSAFTLGILTMGALGSAGLYQYNTVEDAVRKLSNCTQTTCTGKIDGKTAIPAGRYEIRDTYSPRFKKHVLELVGVPGFQGVRIHSGNTADDSEGCLILGLKGTEFGVAESRAAMAQFNADVRKALAKGRIFIVIEDTK
jgi:F420-dependent methylenetetrahydromethanopterin dehydrogenase